MKAQFLHKHKKSSALKTILLVIIIVAILAALTFLGAFIDYYFKIKIVTYVMFVLAFFMAYMLFKKAIVEYKYVYADDVFTVDRMIYDGTKLIFACDKSYICEVTSYSELKNRGEHIRTSKLSFAKKEDCTAVIYRSEESRKAILIYADDEFIGALKEAIK